jgi:hypothetical protein
MYHAVKHRVLPKHLDERLVMLRDAEVDETPLETLDELAGKIRDSNYRVYTTDGEIHLISAHLHLHDRDPFSLMELLRRSGPGGALPKSLDPGHAFYLGYEMCKAATALTLGKTYRQDESLNWGVATQPETRHYLKRTGAPHGAEAAELAEGSDSDTAIE